MSANGPPCIEDFVFINTLYNVSNLREYVAKDLKVPKTKGMGLAELLAKFDDKLWKAYIQSVSNKSYKQNIFSLSTDIGRC